MRRVAGQGRVYRLGFALVRLVGHVGQVRRIRHEPRNRNRMTSLRKHYYQFLKNPLTRLLSCARLLVVLPVFAQGRTSIQVVLTRCPLRRSFGSTQAFLTHEIGRDSNSMHKEGL